MTLAIFPQAIAPDWDVPGGYARYTFGVDSSGEYQSVLKCLLVAPTSTSSSLPLNTPTRVKTPDEVDTLIGARELLAQGARTALELKGVPVYVMRVEDPDGGTASTLTVTATGTSSAFGRYWFTLGRTRFSVSIPSGTTQASAATKIRDAFLAQTRFPTTAATTSNVTTLTIVTPGASGNHWILAYDDSEAPAGQSIAITGGTAFADGIRYQFGNGTGFEDLQAGFDAIYQQTSKVFWYERSAWSSTDTDNAAAIRDFM